MKKKKIKKKILIILLIIIILIILLFLLCNRKLNYKETITIYIGDKIPKSNDYFEKDINVKIKWSNLYKDSNYKVNTYKGLITYKNKDYKVKLKVKDKNPPQIEGVKDINTFVNEKIDFFKEVKISDDSKDEIKKKIEGTYDLKKKGTYNLKYVISDKSNTTTKDFKLIVQEKTKEENNNASTKVNKNSSKGYKVEKKNGIYYVNGILIANKTYPLPSTYNPGDLLEVFKTNFNKMKNDASKEGISLRVISGFRSYNTQSNLYNNYVRRDGKAEADRYSARAGHSEHQTGLAADINSLEQSFGNTKEGRWLSSNCYKYGFIIRYTKAGESETGYMYEPWHIRYVGTSVAKELYNGGNWITLERYLGITSKY